MSGKTFEAAVGFVALAASFIPGIGPAVRMGLMFVGSSFLNDALQPNILSGDQSGMTQNDVSTTAAVPVIYGETRVGIEVADYRASLTGTINGLLYIVGALCHGSRNGKGIEEFSQIYLDERPFLNPVSGIFSEPWLSSGLSVSVQPHRGTDTQVVDSVMHAAFATAWPTTSKGLWIANLVLRLVYKQDIYQSGLPAVTVRLKGMRVYDPRNPTGGPDGDGFIYSTNPSLCILDYLLGFYGCAVDASEINTQSFIDAANKCDTTVTIPGGSQKKFELNGWIDTSRQPSDNLQDMLAACRGMLVYDNGQFRLVIRDTQAPTGFKLTRDNIVGGWKFRTPGVDDAPNIAIMTHVDPTKNYQPHEVQFPDVADPNPFLVADNGFESRMEANLGLVANPYQARQIGMVTLKERRFGKPFEVTVKEDILTQRVGDVIEVTHDVPGWTDQPAWVMSLTIPPGESGLVTLTGFTYDPNMYVLDAQVTTPALPSTELPDPFTVDPIANLQAFTGTSDLRIRVTWEASSDPYIAYYLVQARRLFPHGDPSFITVGRFEADELVAYVGGVAAGDRWEIRVIAVNVNGRQSPAVTVTHTVVIVIDAPFTYVITAYEDMIEYEITFLGGCQFVEFFTRENDAAGEEDPVETSEFSGGYVDRKDGPVVTKQIATRNLHYRKTRMVGYDASWAPGTRSPVEESLAAAAGTAPSGAPSWQTPEADTIDQYSMVLKIVNADITVGCETRIYRDGVVVDRVTSATTNQSYSGPGVNGLNPGQTYAFKLDHVKNGIASAQSIVKYITTLPPDPPPPSFDFVSCSSYEYGPKTYIRYRLRVSGATAGSHEIYESATSDPADGYLVGYTDGFGDYAADKLQAAVTFYYFARGVAPVTDWMPLTENPLDFSDCLLP